MTRWARVGSWVLACVLSAAGCDSGEDLRYAGRRRVAEGDYRVIDVLSDTAGEYALAVDQSRDDELALLPFAGTPCRAGKVASQFSVSNDQGLRLALFATDDSPTEVRLIDAHCKTHLAPVADALDVIVVRGGFLISTASEQLLLLDPWKDRSTLISDSFGKRGSFVRMPARNDDQARALWILEGDELVLRDYTGRVLRRAGRHVTEFALAQNGQSMIFSDADGLYRLDHAGDGPEPLGAPGCNLRYATALHGAHVTDLPMLLSPCDKGRLIAIDLEATNVMFADHVVSYFRRMLASPDGQVGDFTFYVTQADKTADKHYFAAPPSGKAFELGVPISSNSTLIPLGTGNAWLITTAEDPPRLVVFAPPIGVSELAAGVHTVALSPAGPLVLHDYTDAAGTLSVLTQTSGAWHLAELASAVPAKGLSSTGLLDENEETIAGLTALRQVNVVLHDYDGETGTLSQIEASGELVELARAVPAWSPKSYVTSLRGTQLVAATRSVAVLSYLYDFETKPGTGTLAVMTPDDERQVIDHDVTSNIASSDPERPGVLYAKTLGDTHEVWFVQQ